MQNLTILILFISIATLNAQGVVFDDKAYSEAPIKARLMRGDYQVPISASIKQWCPQMGHQLSYSTSVGWAVAWQARTLLYAKNNYITDKDTKNDHIFAPLYVYNKANGTENENCGEGISLQKGLEALKKHGAPFLKDYLYFCGEPNDPGNIDSVAGQYVISEYTKIFELNDTHENKIQLVKKTISEGWPVVIAMKYTPSFLRAREFWQPTEKYNDNLPGHAMCVVGYDNNKYGGAFEVANSWGGNWGNHGFMWIRYKDFAEFVKYAYEMFDVPKEPEYRIKGDVKFKLQSGQIMPVEGQEAGHYKMPVTYTSGNLFQIFVTNEDPAFVYIFGSDLTNQCFRIFPHKNEVSAALTYKSSHIAIPDEQHFIEFDNTPGTDFLCVLYSKEELDFEAILREVQNRKGSFYEKVKSTLGDNFLNDSVSWSTDQIAFEAKAIHGSVVAAIVEIDHN